MMGFQGLDIALAFVAMCCLKGFAWSQYHTCSENIRFPCGHYVYLLDTNASTSLKRQILITCQRQIHVACRVPNPDGECIVAWYNCFNQGFQRELHYLDNVTFSSPGNTELMTQGYTDRNYQIAQNFQCNIKIISKQMKSLYIEVYDFSPYIDNKNYCFSIINRPEIKVCTGSGVIYHYFVTPFDIIDGRYQLNFTIGFIDGLHEFLQLRFFIKFFVGNRTTMTTSCFHDSTSPFVTVIPTAFNNTMSSDTGDQSTVNLINLLPTSQDEDFQTTLKTHAAELTKSADLKHLKIGIGVLGCLVLGLIISMAVISCYLCKIKRETNSRQDPTDVRAIANNHGQLTTMNTAVNNHEYMYPADDRYQNITNDNTSQRNGNLTLNANSLYVPTENY